MARHPQEPILFLIQVDGRDTVAVRAKTSAEARDWFVEHQVDIVRPSPTEAFLLGQFGEVQIFDAKPEYALPLNPDQLPLLPEHSHTHPEDPA